MRAMATTLLFALAGCASSHADSTCPPGQSPMTVSELFFGRSIKNHAPVSEAEWSAFADGTIAREFPDGFTVTDGEGRWRDDATGLVVREQSKILSVAVPRASDVSARLARISEAYRASFHQTSVGVVTYGACGAF